MKYKDEDGQVFRVVVNSGTCNLALLLAVFSTRPEETLAKYLERSAVGVVEEPTLVESKKPSDKGIDLFIVESKRGPGFEIANRLKIGKIDRVLKD
ncbi:hypothetical protein KQI84_01880 [bacterium]|nr:hypothetical protein [bacterium]